MNFRENEIIFLLGAGASANAEIPVSSQMIKKVEELIQTDDKWSEYKDLYNLVKSGILYADGIQGKIDKNFNIERLYNVLNELIKKVEHPLYPFIGSWNIRLNEIIKDNNFKKIDNFQKLILGELKDWVDLKKISNANYFKKLKKFKDKYNNFLRIFSLNYDLCIEKSLDPESFKIQRGFNEDNVWDYKSITDYPKESPPDVFLYKLHGSLDWYRDKNTGEVKFLDGSVKNPELIFGTTYKLQYVDPYLFLFSEFRHYTLKSKLIVIIGYGFGDEHINGILTQALKQDKNRKIYYASQSANKESVVRKLKLKNQNQIEVEKIEAQPFFEKKLTMKQMKKYFPENKTDKLWTIL